MSTVNACAATSATEPLTLTPIDRSYEEVVAVADEPSHIHITRPSRVLRPAAEAALPNIKEARR